MKFFRVFFFVFSLVLISSAYNTISAQDRTGETVRITTKDGNILLGVVEQEDDAQIVLRVEGIGEVTVQKSNIKNIQFIDPERIKEGEYWFENPQGTRYFFAPNAIGLKNGNGYYQNAWILFNNVNYGVSNNFSLGAGTIPVFLFGTTSVPFWILPKLSIPVTNDNLHLGAGALIGGVMGEDSGGFGLFYGNTTLGDRDKNLTIGLGYAYAGGTWSNTPLINISGLYRSSKNIQWLAEIYFLPGIEESGVGIFGGRWAPEKFAVDFGLATPLSNFDFIGIPWLGITIPFGNN